LFKIKVTPSLDEKGVEISLPFGTVNRLIRRDPEVKSVSKEAVFGIGRATVKFSLHLQSYPWFVGYVFEVFSEASRCW
jgi:hypothetical protein